MVHTVEDYSEWPV